MPAVGVGGPVPNAARALGRNLVGLAMAIRMALTLLLVAALGGCANVHCQEQSQNQRANGACGVLSKF